MSASHDRLFSNVALFSRYCKLCCRPCEKVRRLPCEDDFCKKCLRDYISTLTLLELRQRFPCPNCGKQVPVPSLPVAKWTKAFKMDKRTQFYSQPQGCADSDTTKAFIMDARTQFYPQPAQECDGSDSKDDVTSLFSATASTGAGNDELSSARNVTSAWPDMRIKAVPGYTGVGEAVYAPSNWSQDQHTVPFNIVPNRRNKAVSCSQLNRPNAVLSLPPKTASPRTSPLKQKNMTLSVQSSSVLKLPNALAPCNGVHIADTQSSAKVVGHFDSHDYYLAFLSNVHSDTRGCQYWGADTVTDNGNVLLADWMNSTIKMFSPSGNHIADVKKLPLPPLCVSYVEGNTSIVTVGRRGRCLIVLQHSAKTGLFAYQSKVMQGHLYSITRFGGTCLGVYEPYTGSTDGRYRVGLAVLKFNSSKRKASNVCDGKLEVCVFPVHEDILISSNSSVHYNQNDKILYITERSTLYRLDKDGGLLNKFSYEKSDGSKYSLGFVTTLCNGHVLVAADFCVLYLDTAGTLVNVIPTARDPYSIACKQQQNSFFILSNSEQVDEVMLKS